MSLFRSIRWMFAGRLRARIRRAGFVALATAPEGTPVAIRGTIRADESAGPLLEAPLSGAQCVYHASCIDLDVVNTFTMKPHARETRARRFVLECEDGEQAIVEPDHLVVAARFDHVATSMASFDATPRQRALLDTEPVTSWFAVRGVHYYEAVLVPGQAIALLGAGTRELAGTGESGYRDARTRMHFAGAEAPARALRLPVRALGPSSGGVATSDRASACTIRHSTAPCQNQRRRSRS